MDNMEAMDNLMDNFDFHTYWNKKDVLKTVLVYTAVQLGVNILFARAFIRMSTAGASPKGMKFPPSSPTLVR